MQCLLRHAQPRALSSISTICSRPFRHLPRLYQPKSQRRAFSSDLFNYTSGRWLVNEELRLAERKREFNVKELSRLAAESVGRRAEDVSEFVKFAEGEFNRMFLITMHDGFKMIARIPYLFTVPKFYAVASEAATMRFLHSHGIPIPEVYDYSPSPDNDAKTEYIFMEYVDGINLGELWFGINPSQLSSVLRQLVQLESRVMDFTFPACGSLYYTEDLGEAGEGPGFVPLLEDERFSVGVDARLPMWHGRRSGLEVYRGPYIDIIDTLIAPAVKEKQYLEQLGRPMQLFRRERRQAYRFEVQQPLDYVEVLKIYIAIALRLIPKNLTFHRPHIRHPNLRPDNVLVSISPDSGKLKVVSLINWQHASILPQCLHAEVPEQLHSRDDMVSFFADMYFKAGGLENFAAVQQEYLRACALVQSLYIQHAKEYNKPHHDALVDPVCMLLRHLFIQAGLPWMGEIHELRTLLIAAADHWKDLVGEDVHCPVTIDPEVVLETLELSRHLATVDEATNAFQVQCCFKTKLENRFWVPNELHEDAKLIAAETKDRFIKSVREKEGDNGVAEIYEASWVLDDFDETGYH